MKTAEASLPSLPLWVAALVALSAEAALLAGLSQWTPPRASEPPEVPIEVSLVSAPVLADSAAAGAVGGPSEATPEPEIEPESEPPPVPLPVRPPDPTPVAVVQPKPKPKPVSKPKPVKPVSKPKPKVQPKAKPKATSKPDTGPARTTASATGEGTGTRNARPADKGASGAGGSSPAAYLSNPAPGYPDAARRQRQEGTVSLRVLVSANGQASQVVLAGSSGVSSLDQAALRAVRRWRFKPARQNGQPISAWVRVPVRFTLDRSGG